MVKEYFAKSKVLWYVSGYEAAETTGNKRRIRQKGNYTGRITIYYDSSSTPGSKHSIVPFVVILIRISAT
jgi:hypothetical protein